MDKFILEKPKNQYDFSKDEKTVWFGFRIPKPLYDKLFRMTVQKGFIDKSECARFCMRIGLEYLEMEWLD